MRRAAWTQTATDDLREAERYLTGIHEAIARDLVERAVAAGRFSLDYPAIGSPMRGRWRKWRIPGTRYLLIYRPTPSGIEIGRVRYGRSRWTLVPA